MCGAFYLVEYQPELEEYFEIGNEIECYRDPDDLIEKIRHYLVRPQLCESIGRAGRARCLREHTYLGAPVLRYIRKDRHKLKAQLVRDWV
jgi:spore maturation protein CgeB